MMVALGRQRAAFAVARPEPLSLRRNRLGRLVALLVDNRERLTTAMGEDYGQRSAAMSALADVLPAVSLARYCLANLARWARPERRRPTFPLGLFGGRADVRYEPKGVVGIVSPWNFPVGLALAPLAQVLAAGNRAMLKPSERTPRTAELLAELIAASFAADEVTVCLGGVETGKAFTALPFDHLLFTGATAIGREVMRAAAENLVPVTLELGGKSPVIIGKGADLRRAGERIAVGKLLNAGQVCVAPDYLLVPAEREDAAISAIAEATARLYPTMLANDDYGALINARHRDRIRALIDDARDKGAEAIEVNPAGEDFAATNQTKLPLTILRNVTLEMAVMREEIFGPVLPVVPYQAIGDAIDTVSAADRPLALYYFGDDAAEREAVMARTISGGVTVNDAVFHVSMDDLPFGGTGASGMGAYHGIEGFRTFSHARAVYRQPRLDIAALVGIKPPYGAATRRMLWWKLRR